MALVIRVLKSEIPKVQALNNHIVDLCYSVEQTGEDQIYWPVSGKLIEMLELFYQHGIAYTIHSSQPNIGQG